MKSLRVYTALALAVGAMCSSWPSSVCAFSAMAPLSAAATAASTDSANVDVTITHAFPSSTTVSSTTTTPTTSTHDTAKRTLPCLGFLLPNASSVVTSARCASDSHALNTVVLIGADHAPLLVTVTTLHANALYREDDDDATKWAYEAAVGSLVAPLSASNQSPVLFRGAPNTAQSNQQSLVIRYAVYKSAGISSEPSAGDDLSCAFVLKQSTVRIVANSECEAIAGKRLSQSGSLCGKSVWASIEECQSAAADDNDVKYQLITIKQGDEEFALGFIAESFDCSMRDSTSLLVVTSVVDLLIDAVVSHSDPTPSPSSFDSVSSQPRAAISLPIAQIQTSEPPLPGQSGSGSSSSAGNIQAPILGTGMINPQAPVVRSPSLSSGSPSAEVSLEPPSTSDTDADDSSEVIPDELFSKVIQYPFAYLSSAMNASIKSVAAFHVSPAFLMTSSSWIKDQEAIKWVLFEDDKIPIKKLWLESDELALTSNIVMVELERAYRRGGARLMTARLEDSVVLQLSFLDPASLLLLQNRIPSGDNVHLVPLDECGFGGFASTQEEGLSCVTSQWATTTTSSSIVRMGFVMYDGQLVGLGSRHHKLGGTVIIPFFLLSVQMRLDFVLSVFVESQKSVVLSPEELKYHSFVVRFFEDNFPVDCGGVLIAQDAVLTTATCASVHHLSMCLYGTGENTHQMTIAKDATVVHPLYSRGWARDTRYDFAIVKLEQLLPASAAIALAPTDFVVGSEVARVDLSSPVGVEACVVVESEQCGVSSESICATHAERLQVEPKTSSSTALVGAYRSKTVLLGLQSSLGGNSSIHSYSKITDAADFIHSNVYGIPDSPGGGEDDEDTGIPDEVVKGSLRYPFAYLSDTMNASTKSVAAFHVSPRFLVANGDWISDRDQIKWVLFDDSKIPVKRLWYENDGANFGYPMANFIVAIELERAYAQPGVKPVTLLLEDESAALQLSFLDPTLMYENGFLSIDNAHLASLDACGLHDAATVEEDGVSCLMSEWHDANSLSAMQMGFVMLDGKLAGLVSGYQRLTEETRMRFLMISQLRRNFMVSVFVQSEQSVALSPEEALYRNSVVQFFEDDFPVDCGGMVIAPDAILTTASCTSGHRFSFALWRTEAGSQGLETLPNIVVHPLYQATNKETYRYNFAIVKLASNLLESAVVALASADITVGSEVVRVDFSGLSGVETCTLLDTAVCIGLRSPQLAAPSDLFLSSAPTGTAICAGNANGDVLQTTSDSAALLSTIDGTSVLVGLQADQDGVPSADSYTGVLNAVEFVNANVFGRKWSDEPSETQEISDEVFQSSVRYPFVYVSSCMNASVRSVAAAHISPSVVVMNAKWIYERGDLQWVLFEDDKIAVQKYYYEGDYRVMMGLPISDETANLMLVKLERPYVRNGSSVDSLSFLPTQPLKPFEVKYLDPILLQRGLPQDQLSSVDADNTCPLDDFGSVPEGVDCVFSTLQSVNPFARGTPMRMGFLLKDGVVSGLGIGIHSLAEEVTVPFARLDFDPRKAFIDYTTSLWSQDVDVEATPEEMVYRGAAVRLIASGKILDCGGMLIAPEFVLTTASCAQAREVTAVLFGFGNDAVFVSVLPGEAMVHPSYQSGNASTLRYNIAILKLSSPQPSSVPIVLAPFEKPVGSDVVRVDLSGGTHVVTCRVLETDKCLHSPVPTSLLPGGTICAGNESFPLEDASSTSAALVGTMRDTLVLVGLQVGPDDDPFTDSYMSILSAANFINAYVLDHVWGSKGTPNFSPLRNDVSFMVGLRMTKSGQSFCGGTLIASQFVLTAAHCVSDGLVKWVRVGYNRSDPNDAEEIQVLADRIRIHPRFGSPNMYSFDAAILELATPAYNLPVVLDKAADFADNKASTLFSFGAPTSGATISLQDLELPLWSQKKCQAVVPGVDGSALCAGGELKKDACTGDSGSPLIIDFKKPSEGLIGLVSAGYGCGQAGFPGIYTRVSSIRDFIAAYATPAADSSHSEETEAPTMSPLYPTSASPVPLPVGSTGSSGTHDSNQIGNSKATTPTPTKADDGAFASPILHQKLPQTTEIMTDKVLIYLLGGDDALAVSTELRDRLMDPSNDLTLYSRGDLSGVLQVIAAHDALPLNQRQDRFGSVSARQSGDEPKSTGKTCR